MNTTGSPTTPRIDHPQLDMMLTQWITVALLFISATLASPAVTVRNSPITLPFARRINATSVRELLKIDQARAKSIKNRPQVQPHTKSGSAAVFGVPATNQAVDYILNVRTPTLY